MFFEHRQYRIKPGQRNNWVKYMDEVIIPHAESQGIVVTASFVGQEEEDFYLWVPRFESDAEYERLNKQAYQSDHWKNDIAPRIPDMLDREGTKITRIEATPKSVMQ